MLLMLLSTVSCIQLKPADASSEASTEETALPTQSATDAEDVSPLFPVWSDAESVAKAFLLSGADAAGVDCSERDYSYLEMQEDLAR